MQIKDAFKRRSIYSIYIPQYLVPGTTRVPQHITSGYRKVTWYFASLCLSERILANLKIWPEHKIPGTHFGQLEYYYLDNTNTLKHWNNKKNTI